MPDREDIIELEITSKTQGDWTILQLEGEVDIYTAGKLREALTQVMDEKRYRIAVDLSGMEFADSSGLGVLIAALKRVKEHEGELVLVAPRDQMRRILSLTGLDKILTIRQGLADIGA